MFDHAPAPSYQVHASRIFASRSLASRSLASFGAMTRCPRCDAVGPMDIKSINPGLCGNDIIVYQCMSCGAEHAGNAGSDPVLHVG